MTNLASRLSTHAAAGRDPHRPAVHAAVEDDVDVEPVGEIELKGFARPIPAYNVLKASREEPVQAWPRQ